MSNTEPTSLRHYFAANAPAEIPDWFQPDMAHLPLPEKPEDITLDSFGQPFGPAYEAWHEAMDLVKDQRAEYRYFAWRWYYSDQMVKQKHGPSKPLRISAETLAAVNSR